MAKAKYYLMTADFVDGKEAERIGLVSLCVPRAQLMDKAMATADKLANGSQMAIRYTKRSLNNWMRMSQPAFYASLALEMLCFLGDDAKEGVAAVREKREPKFPSASSWRALRSGDGSRYSRCRFSVLQKPFFGTTDGECGHCLGVRSVLLEILQAFMTASARCVAVSPPPRALLEELHHRQQTDAAIASISRGTRRLAAIWDLR